MGSRHVAAATDPLETTLETADDPAARYHVREALQYPVMAQEAVDWARAAHRYHWECGISSLLQ